MKRILLFLGIVVAGIDASAAWAGPVRVLGPPESSPSGAVHFFTNFFDFREAVGDLQVNDFETLPDGRASVAFTPITPKFNYTGEGVTFSSPFPELYIGPTPGGGFSLDAQHANTTQRNWIVANFVVPVTAIGIEFPGNTTLSVLDVEGALIATATHPTGGFFPFIGILSDRPISAAIQDRGSSGEIMNEILFAPIPEPTTLLLAGLALVGTVLLHRRI